jgi:hypothetical protein
MQAGSRLLYKAISFSNPVPGYILSKIAKAISIKSVFKKLIQIENKLTRTEYYFEKLLYSFALINLSSFFYFFKEALEDF